MFWTGFAVGCFVGAAFGVLIMYLVVAGKRLDERTVFADQCQKCDVFINVDGDISKCRECEKGI